MVVGGYKNGEALNNVEIISKDPNNKCTAEISQLPIKAHGMVGGFTKRAAIVCGGGTDKTNTTNACFEYLPKSNRYHFVCCCLNASVIMLYFGYCTRTRI